MSRKVQRVKYHLDPKSGGKGEAFGWLFAFESRNSHPNASLQDAARSPLLRDDGWPDGKTGLPRKGGPINISPIINSPTASKANASTLYLQLV
jgi:hypothetical protein